MALDEDKSRIEELKRSLYSRTSPDVRTRRRLHFSDSNSPVESSWGDEPEEVPESALNTSYQDHSMSFLKKILIASVIFCVLAIGIGAYLFFNGSNLISANNIDIKIGGPVSIPGGGLVNFDITMKNNNNVDLQSVDMSVAYPAGTIDPADSVTELKKYTKFIGNLPTGGTASESVQAVMFGEENLQKEIVVSLTYSIKGSTAVFTKSASYQVLINSSPISVTASSFKEITSGQEFDTQINIKSNSDQVLKNVLLSASYPFGFLYISSNVKSISSDNTLWKIGDIAPGSSRMITIRGKLQGENADTRSFRFDVGAQDSSGANRIGTEYMSIQNDISIQKPFISLSISIDNDNALSDFVAEYSRARRVDVSWFNNLPMTVTNAQIIAHLSGSAYDKNLVSPDAGYFRSATDDIIWNQQTVPELASVEAGGSGHVSFSITPRNVPADSEPVVNPKIVIDTSVSGDRSQESQVPETLSSVTSRTIRVSSNVSLTGRIVRTTGPFTNTGPIPPKAEQKTTYTIVWSVDNTSSAVGNAKVSATLPIYVKWLNNVSPSSEDVSFDTNTGVVTWNIGNISTYTTNSSRRREVYFQISFEPGVDLAEQMPTLINQAKLTGVDNYTGINLSDTQDFLTTSFSTDPAYNSTDGYVAR
jgi:hypothetical protein